MITAQVRIKREVTKEADGRNIGLKLKNFRPPTLQREKGSASKIGAVLRNYSKQPPK
jgi:hypothetical protein